MYFLTHMYILMKAFQKLQLEEWKLQPLIVGTWGPDIGYFPFFSWQFKKFTHTRKPQFAIFEDKRKNDLFRQGWKIHLLCDDLIHNQPFFQNKKPFCPPIIRGSGFKFFFKTSLKHLGREVSLDLYVYNYYLKNDKITRANLFQKELYYNENVNLDGFRFLQAYVYNYTHRVVPKLSINTDCFIRQLKKKIDYPLFSKKNIKLRIDDMLQNAIDESEIILQKIAKRTRKEEKVFNEK